MRGSLVLGALGTCLAAAPAHGRDGAWYVGGDFGAMIVEDTEFDFGLAPTIASVDHDTGLDGALFVGYDLGAFRLEAEVAYKRASVDEIDATFAIPTPPLGSVPAGRHPLAGGSTSALSFMLNGMLDLGDDDGLGGFFGGGAGIARVGYDNIRVFENTDPYLDDGDTRFAWQIVAGVRQAVGENVDVTFRYRFFNVPGVTVPDIGGFDGEGGFRSHSILAGLTFNFGQPESP